jgi:energy-coupling factor transporter ATP-binding protein EcfA2
MKLSSLFVSHFLGANAVDLQLRQPVQLFAGKNGAGKSSLRDAIALALTADIGRVGLKKHAAELIADGTDLAVCEVKAGADEYRVSINRAGKITDSRVNASGTAIDAVLPYVLDAQRFARMEDIARRAFLFGLMGVKLEPAAIKARLIDRKLDATKVERILPLLRAGFDAACKEAKGKATEAKGAWRAVTGETYGSEKAKTWRAAVPRHDPAALRDLATKLQHLDAAAESWQQTVGRLQAEETRRATLRASLPGLQERAARIKPLETKLATDEQQFAEIDAAVNAAAAAGGTGPRVGLVHDLAASLAYACNFIDNNDPRRDEAMTVLDAYEAEHGIIGIIGVIGGDPEARAKLPELQSARALMASAIVNDKRDLAAATAAKTEAEKIATELAEVFDAAGLDDAREKTAALKTERATIVADLEKLKSLKAAADAAEAKTTGAAAHAADVAAWDAVGDALAPDGIPGELLAEALGPMNERLFSSSVDTDWLQVVIAADMTITGGGRAYPLLSESEKWRCDAMLAEAVSHLSGARLLVLDRIDVLDGMARGELLGWLDVLATTGEIDTALIFGTLKSAPAGLPDTIGCHWIENGVVAQLREAA